MIDITFDVYSDTPFGRDPDSYSPTLRRFHRQLWSKALPNGRVFQLSTDRAGCYLHHQSDLGEWVLSSDSIGHTYRNVKSMAHIIKQASIEELDEFFSICSTVGAYTIFPARRIDGKPTINGARGLNSRIKDRFDLTLECIRRHYAGQPNPLGDVLARYGDFFKLFGDFNGYVEYFLFQDLVDVENRAVKFFLPFKDFDSDPLPSNIMEYKSYRTNVTAFVQARNLRIETESSRI